MWIEWYNKQKQIFFRGCIVSTCWVRCDSVETLKKRIEQDIIKCTHRNPCGLMSYWNHYKDDIYYYGVIVCQKT